MKPEKFLTWRQAHKTKKKKHSRRCCLPLKLFSRIFFFLHFSRLSDAQFNHFHYRFAFLFRTRKCAEKEHENTLTIFSPIVVDQMMSWRSRAGFYWVKKTGKKQRRKMQDFFVRGEENFFYKSRFSFLRFFWNWWKRGFFYSYKFTEFSTNFANCSKVFSKRKWKYEKCNYFWVFKLLKFSFQSALYSKAIYPARDIYAITFQLTPKPAFWFLLFLPSLS
jgi:hypothetical protein